MRSEAGLPRAIVVRGDGGGPRMVIRTGQGSGRFTFAVSFVSAPPEVRESLVAQLERMGCRLEWSCSDLFRIDAHREPLAQQVLALLMHVEAMGHLVFEAGRIARPRYVR